MDTDSKFNKVLDARIMFGITVGSLVATVIIYFMAQISPLNTQIAVLQTQVDNIKNNDLTHIELSQRNTESVLTGLQLQNSQILQQLSAVNAVLKIK